MSWSRDGNIGVPLREAPLRQVGERAAGVEPQPVVAADASSRPRRSAWSITTGRMPSILESYGCCDTRGPGADDHDVALAHPGPQ